MTGTIRKKPTKKSRKMDLMRTRSSRSRVRASYHRESARKRRDYRCCRRSTVDCFTITHDVYPSIFHILNRNEESNYIEGIDLDSFDYIIGWAYPIQSQNETICGGETEMIELMRNIGCNV